MASFTCSVNLAGSGYSLTARSGGLTPAASSAFDVAALASDNFERANGPLTNWTDFADGGLAISNQTVVGTNTAATRVTCAPPRLTPTTSTPRSPWASRPLVGSDWVRPGGAGPKKRRGRRVRGPLLLGLGQPQLMLLKRVNGIWTQLGSTYASGALPAGTTLTLTVVGPTLTFAQNGATVITATDTSLTWGRPASWPMAPPAPATGRAATWPGRTLWAAAWPA